MKTLYQTKNPELIAPLNKITPPPPNSYKTHLNKGSRPKYLSLLKQFTVITIVAISAIIPLIDCSLPDDSQGVTDADKPLVTYNPIEVVVYTAVIEVLPVLNDDTWTGTYKATNLPTGLTIDENTGAISGTPIAASGEADYIIILTSTGDSNGMSGSTSVSITILPHTLIHLTATQLQITDGTRTNGTTKHASHFMVFDISTTNTVSTTIPVEFLLVKDGVTVPTTLEEFRQTVSISMTMPTAKDYDLSMAFKSALLPSENTSLYMAHDSQGGYPLTAGTQYTLYAAQPESSNTAPVSLGSFTTGTHATYTGSKGFIEVPGTAPKSGNFYMEGNQFLVLAILTDNSTTSTQLNPTSHQILPLLSNGTFLQNNNNNYLHAATKVTTSQTVPFPAFYSFYTDSNWADKAGSTTYKIIFAFDSADFTFHGF